MSWPFHTDAPSSASWLGGRRHIVGVLAFTALYGAVLLWFARVDVYHEHFSESGLLVFLNNVCRVLFMFYLFWMVHAAGALLLRLVSRKLPDSDGALGDVAVRFFAGSGVWHLLLLALGYLSLYTRPIMAAITVPIVALSYRSAHAAADVLRQWWRDRRASDPLTVWPISVALGLFIVVLMIKGLYPGGGHDYFSHYFLYDSAVVERGNLWPNDVWYHYYYSKGAGLFFLAMLLTDPLAPQTVSFTFFAASLIALFLLLRRFALNSRWAWASVILYIGLFVYTPGVGGSRAHGGWGDFEKLHELNAALTVAIIWLSTRMLESHGRMMLAALTAAASSIAAAVIINTTAAAYFVVIFALLMLWFAWKRMLGRAIQCASLAAIAGAFAVATLLVNQLTTGLMSDQIPDLAWKFANVERLHQWGVLPPLLVTLFGRAGMTAEGTTLVRAITLLVKTSRLEMFGPLLCLGMVTAVAAARRGRIAVPAPTQVLVVAVALSSAIAFALTTGIAQPISFYRYTSFIIPIVLLCGVVLVRVGAEADGQFGHFLRHPMAPYAVIAACFITAFISYHPRRAPMDALFDASRFAVGWYSIDKAYTTQKGFPSRAPYGGIYPGARGAYEAVGPHVPILSISMLSYCMLPGCRVESWPSFATSPDWDRLMFGTPEEGRDALQSAGLNYVLFSTDLYLNSDPLLLSPLLAPHNIARYFGIRWTDGTSSLLTWLGPGITPLDEAWLVRYRRAVADSGALQSFPLETFRAIYVRLRTTPHPWHSFVVPWSIPAR